MSKIGIVVIGRNEGERLKNCIRSLSNSDLNIVYVDSASSDDSVAYVKQQGFDVIELDMSIPFSAARARNEGYQYLLSAYSDIDYIQFFDGDCEVCEGWIATAHKCLEDNPRLAAVCGRTRERFPDKTIYNKLCEIEWDAPVGPTKSTGGGFMCRRQALVEVGGFDPRVIAGEEPELCFRLRQSGWEIERLGHDMVLHDADMTSFRQWWRRTERSGHAYAQAVSMHGRSHERYYVKDLVRVLLWALLIPAFTLVFTVFFSAWFLLLLLVYPLKIAQIAQAEIKRHGFYIGLVHASTLVLCKFPQFKGVIHFVVKYLTGQNFKIIEHKNASK